MSSFFASEKTEIERIKNLPPAEREKRCHEIISARQARRKRELNQQPNHELLERLADKDIQYIIEVYDRDVIDLILSLRDLLYPWTPPDLDTDKIFSDMPT